MEAAVKAALNTKTLTSFGSGGGGCINRGQGYTTDDGTKIFIKINSKNEARGMFEGEHASLTAILATGTIKAPAPYVVLDNPSGGAALVMEYLDLSSQNKYSAQLGEQIARMHLHNETLARHAAGRQGSIHKLESGRSEHVLHVSQFGFHTTTCCGLLPQDNTWTDDWVTFYCRHKLQQQIDLLQEKICLQFNIDPIQEAKDTDIQTLWGKLLPQVPSFFKDLQVTPSLLHGDLWGGNVGETNTGPVTFDPASLYGHHEYDLSIATMFGGFDATFFEAYHNLIPKAAGHDTRLRLYQLFHYLNHWNHFGGGYKSSAISIMKELT